MDTKSRALPMARVNTRIRPDQQRYVKMLAKKNNSTEGEIFRAIIDAHKQSKETYQSN